MASAIAASFVATTLTMAAPGAAPIAQALTNLTVTSPALSGATVGSLQAMLNQASTAMAGGDDVVISFDPSLNGAVFQSDGAPRSPISANYTVTVPAGRSLTIAGTPSAAAPIFDGLSQNPLFQFSGQGTVTMRDLVLRNGQSGSLSMSTSGDGGAINTTTGLVLERVTMSGNGSLGSGGAIFSLGPVTIRNSSITNSIGDGGGGAIELASSSSSLLLEASTMSLGSNGGGGGSGGAIQCLGCQFVRVTAGSVLNNNNGRDGGGAIHVLAGSLTVSDSTIRDNSTFTGDGAGIQADSLSTVEIVNSTLIRNDAQTAGGAIACESCSGVQITGSVISDNEASTQGAGIYSSTGSGPLTITDSLLSGNDNPTTGGGVLYQGSNLVIVGSRLVSNSASLSGGAVSTRGAVTIESSVLEGNNGGLNGGGLYCNNCTTVTLSGAAFVGNTGATGGGADIEVVGSLGAVDTTFSSNVAATTGQALMLRSLLPGSGTVALDHVTIANHTGNRPALAIDPVNTPAATMTNSIIASNTSNCDVPPAIDGLGRPSVIQPDTAGTLCRLENAGLVEADPGLLPLATLGGPDLADGQPIPVVPFNGASIANNLASCTPGQTDARGEPRSAVACDVGAFELDLTVVTQNGGLQQADTPASLVRMNAVPTAALTPPSGNGSENSQALTTAQVRGIDLESSPLRNIPLRNIGLTAADIDPSVLASISLAQIPLDYTGGWTAYLNAVGLTLLADQPLNTVSLLQVLEATKDLDLPEELQLSLGQLDLSKTPLGSLPVGAVALAGAALDDLAGTVPINWCALIVQYTDRPCDPVGTPPPGSDPIYTASATLVSLSLEGIPLRNIPLRNIPLRNIDLNSTPLRNIPLRNIPLRNIDLSVSPLRNIPLRNIPLRNIPLVDDDGVTYNLTTVVAAPLRNIPLRNIPLRNIGTVQASPLRNIPLRNIELAGSPLRNIPLRNIPLRNIGDVAASPLRNIPLRNIDVTNSPLRNIPLRNIPLRNIDVNVSPLRNIPLRNIELLSSPLRNIPLRNITTVAQIVDCSKVDCTATGVATIASAIAAGAMLPTATLGALANGVPGTTDLGLLGDIVFAEGDPYILGDVVDAIALDGSLTLAALAEVFLADLDGKYTLAALADLAAGEAALNANIDDLLFNALTIHDLLDILLATPSAYGISQAAADGIREGIENLLVDDLIGLLAELEPPVTLADLFLGVVEADDFPWDELDLDVAADGLRSVANPDGVPFAVQVTATVPVSALELSVDLPPGFTYVPGSVSLPAGASIVGEPTLTPTETGSTLLRTGVSLPVVAPGTVSTLGVRVQPPLEVGSTDQVTATVSAPAWAMAATSKEGYLLNDVLENNDVPTGPTPLDEPADTLVVSYVRQSGDVDWFGLEVEQGEEMSFNLSNLPADYDMLLFGPAQTISLRGVPSRSLVPAADNGLSLLGENVAVAQIAADVDTSPPAGYRLIQGSARRGTDVERIETGPLAAGQYLLKVSGYNGANAKRPYVLRTRIEGETSAQQCAAAHRSTAPLSLGSAVTTIDDTTDTIVLVDTARLDGVFPGPATYGVDDAPRTAQDVVDALESFTTTLASADSGEFGGTRAAVVDLATVQPVEDAYDDWDDDPCDPELANGVVAAIGSHLDSILTPEIENVVILGADDQIPMARLVDGTPAHNESEYAGTWNEANPVSASLALGYMLSDDPYSTASPIALGARQLFVPELAVGRLVESPDDIVTALTNFVGSNGLLDPDTAISTGYDFLEDGARAVAAELEPSLVANVDETLISTGVNAWTKADIVEHFAVAGPDVASVNAHFDHYRALPADQDASGRLTNPLTLSDVRTAPADGTERPLDGSLIFSMGCHGGLSVSDVAVGTLDADWAQTFAGEGAAMFAGNTGYGYGDTAVVAFSEELMRLFAERLSQAPTIGSAMAAAKQRYISDLAVISSFEEKVSSQVVFYGLPMYRIGGAAPPPVEPFETVVSDPVSGLPSSVVHVATSPQPEPSQFGTYYTVNGEVQATPYQPVQPRTSTDVTAEGRTARGAVITGLVSHDVNAIDPVIVTPADDAVGPGAEAASRGAVFPSVLQSVARVTDVGGERDRLVVIPGQFRGDPDAPEGRGVQRLFPQIDARVLYAPTGNTDTTPPRISTSSATAVNGTATITVDVPDGDAVRVLALYVASNAPDPKTWLPLDLTSSDGHTWQGSAAIAAGVDQIDYFVQVVDSGGNVSVASGKGANFESGTTTEPPPDTPVGVLAIDVAPGQATYADKYVGSVGVSARSSNLGTKVKLSVNGIVATNPTTLSETGTYQIVASANGHTSLQRTIVIDNRGPTTQATVLPAPNANGWNNTPVVVLLTTQPNGIPVTGIRFKLDDLPEIALPIPLFPVPILTQGEHVVRYWAVDALGRAGAVATTTVRIDWQPPVVTCPAAPTFLLNQPNAKVTATVQGATTAGPLQLTAATNVVGARTATGPAVVDLAGNSTTPSCPYNVRYKVEGFQEPTTMNMINRADVNKVVPIKWRLTDYNGAAVTDSSSFKKLDSTSINCPSGTIDDIETYVSSASTTPQHTGSGNWQYNWKTDKSWAGKCRTLTLELKDGSQIAATFKFK